MNKNTVLNLAPNILKRMEYDIDRFYLLDFNQDEIWIGNFASYLFISELNGIKSLNDIVETIKHHFENYSAEDIFDSILEIAKELLEKKFLVKVC